MTVSYLFLISLFLVPFAISWFLTLLLIRLAPRLGLVDQPNARKIHTQPTPRAGGLAIYVALAVTALAFPSTLQFELVTSLLAGFFIVVLGLIDDIRPLPWQLRLGVQALVAMAVVFTLYAELSWVLFTLEVIWIVGLVNAFNMLDNMDALSAGVAWIAAGMLALGLVVSSDRSQEWLAALPYLMFMGSISGFLWFNLPPARIFMGDAGSTFLGFFLGLGSLHDIRAGDSPSPVWFTPLCILAVPWYDLGSVVILRIWQGRSPFHADRQHLSHRLVALGLHPVTAVRLIYGMGLASGAVGFLLYRLSVNGALIAVCFLVCVWLAVACVEYIRHFPPATSE